MANLVAVALFVLALFLAATWPEHYDPASSPNKPVVSFDALKGFDPEAELAPEKTRLVDQSLINAVTNTVTSFVGSDTGYDRDLYEHWSDDDGDCQNVRHELLQTLSTGAVTFNQNGCLVRTGRWYDPFSDQYFFNSSDVDVDHVVPLYWAHQRGGYLWDAKTRKMFANDAGNLLVVSRSLNRAKGAKAPYEWLPPNKSFQCQYTLRFKRVASYYRLLNDEDSSKLDRVIVQVCDFATLERLGLQPNQG